VPEFRPLRLEFQGLEDIDFRLRPEVCPGLKSANKTNGPQ